MFLLSEAVFFFMLIVAFVYFRSAPLPQLAFRRRCHIHRLSRSQLLYDVARCSELYAA